MRYKALRQATIEEALKLMPEGWELAAATRENAEWVLLLGRPDYGFENDPSLVDVKDTLHNIWVRAIDRNAPPPPEVLDG